MNRLNSSLGLLLSKLHEHQPVVLITLETVEKVSRDKFDVL